jgi:tetratricopeptide (TPR) repeat protein
VTEPARLGWRKRAAFTAVALLVPLLFFVLLEGALRLGGYGDDYPLFVDVEGVPGVRVQNPEFARRYFYGQPTVPTGLQDYFAEVKTDSTLRLVVQGGSTAAGFPFYAGGAFSRMLEQRLQQTFPDRTVEVVNTALAAVNSFTLLDAADEVVAVQPDAVLIYAGHNEYYGALGAGSSVSLGSSPALTRLYLRLQHLRTVQLVRDALSGLASLAAEPDDGGTTLMSRMVSERAIAAGSGTYRAALEAFEQNMTRLLDRYRQRGVPVFLSTIASNERDQPPFVTLYAQPETESQLAAAQRLAAAGEMRAARAAAQRLDAADSLCAGCSFLLAQTLEQEGDLDGARGAYIRARDRDGLRFRASSAVNAILRRLAERSGVTLVDAEASMRAQSPGQMIGSAMMVEHLHPQPAGFFAIADAFYDALMAHPVTPDARPVDRAVARAEGLLTPVDSLVGTYRVRQLMSVWPFQPPGVRAPLLDTLTLYSSLDSLALRLFRREIGWAEANERQLQLFRQRGDTRGALQAALARVQEYPFDASGYLAAGSVLTQQRRLGEALDYFRAAADRAPTSEAFMMIGSIYLEEGHADRALAQLEKALELDAGNVQARYNLAGALALTGQLEEARKAAQMVLEARPGHGGARLLLAQLPPA